MLLTVWHERASAQAAPGSTCRITVTQLNFGEYSALDEFPSLSLGRVEVDCRGSNDFPSRVTLSSGRSGNPYRRYMAHGTGILEYNVYADPARRLVTGDGSGGTTPLVPRLRSLGRNIFVLFGEIPPRQAVRAGEYHDELKVELEF